MNDFIDLTEDSDDEMDVGYLNLYQPVVGQQQAANSGSYVDLTNTSNCCNQKPDALDLPLFPSNR